jgi:hypothetical protein
MGIRSSSRGRMKVKPAAKSKDQGQLRRSDHSMATVTQQISTTQIGETAGMVWRVLSEAGPVSLAKLPKMVDANKDLILLALGWLAREDKLAIDDRGRTKIVSLVESN